METCLASAARFAVLAPSGVSILFPKRSWIGDWGQNINRRDPRRDQMRPARNQVPFARFSVGLASAPNLLPAHSYLHSLIPRAVPDGPALAGPWASSEDRRINQNADRWRADPVSTLIAPLACDHV